MTGAYRRFAKRPLGLPFTHALVLGSTNGAIARGGMTPFNSVLQRRKLVRTHPIAQYLVQPDVPARTASRVRLTGSNLVFRILPGRVLWQVRIEFALSYYSFEIIRTRQIE